MIELITVLLFILLRIVITNIGNSFSGKIFSHSSKISVSSLNLSTSGLFFYWRATSLCNLKILAYNCFFEYLFGIKNQERHLHLQRQFGCRKYIYRHIVYKHQISQITQKYPHRYDNHFS